VRPDRATLAIATAAVLAFLVARATVHETRTPDPGAPPIDERFAPLVAAARGERRLGYLTTTTDGREERTRRVHAQYALAPALLVAGGPFRLYVAWAESGGALDRLARERGLRVLARIDAGYALLERTGP